MKPLISRSKRLHVCQILNLEVPSPIGYRMGTEARIAQAVSADRTSRTAQAPPPFPTQPMSLRDGYLEPDSWWNHLRGKMSAESVH